MKFMKRAGIFKASNVTFNPETCQAHSYDWWMFVNKMNGLVVFNDYGYSNSTRKHQSKVRSLLASQGIEIDVYVTAPCGLQREEWKAQTIKHLTHQIEEVTAVLSNPRRKKTLDGKRSALIASLTQDRSRLQSFINSIKE